MSLGRFIRTRTGRYVSTCFPTVNTIHTRVSSRYTIHDTTCVTRARADEWGFLWMFFETRHAFSTIKSVFRKTPQSHHENHGENAQSFNWRKTIFPVKTIANSSGVFPKDRLRLVGQRTSSESECRMDSTFYSYFGFNFHY